MKEKNEYRDLIINFLMDLGKIWNGNFANVKTDEEKVVMLREYLSAIETLILIAVPDIAVREMFLIDLEALHKKRKDKEKNKKLN